MLTMFGSQMPQSTFRNFPSVNLNFHHEGAAFISGCVEMFLDVYFVHTQKHYQARTVNISKL